MAEQRAFSSRLDPQTGAQSLDPSLVRGGFAADAGNHTCESVGLDSLGITNPSLIYRNLDYHTLFAHEKRNNEGDVLQGISGDVFAVDTGKFTGRSPK